MWATRLRCPSAASWPRPERAIALWIHGQSCALPANPQATTNEAPNSAAAYGATTTAFASPLAPSSFVPNSKPSRNAKSLGNAWVYQASSPQFQPHESTKTLTFVEGCRSSDAVGSQARTRRTRAAYPSNRSFLTGCPDRNSRGSSAMLHGSTG